MRPVGITTDNYTGYTATLTNPTNSTDLINTSDNTLVIPTITLPANTNSITASAFDGTGFTVTLEGSFPWTTNSLSPIISLSGLINGGPEGIVLNMMYPASKQRYTNLSGTKITFAAWINKMRAFQYTGSSNPNNTKKIMYNTSPNNNVQNNNNNTLGWLQSNTSLVASFDIIGTPNGNAMNIDIKVYNYSTQSGRGSLIGILPTRSVFTVSGLEQSGITIELGHYERDSNTQFNYSFTVYNLSVQKTTTP